MSDPAAEIERRDEGATGLSVLAGRANQAHHAARDAALSALEHARSAGEALNEAKERVEYGEWTDWVAENFDASLRTAQRYQRIASRWDELTEGGEAEAPRVAHLTLRAADRRLSDADEEDEETSNGSEPDGGEPPEREEPDVPDEERGGKRDAEPPRQTETADEGSEERPARADSDAGGREGTPTPLLGRYRRLAEFCDRNSPAATAASLTREQARDVLDAAERVEVWTESLRDALSDEGDEEPESRENEGCLNCDSYTRPGEDYCSHCSAHGLDAEEDG